MGLDFTELNSSLEGTVMQLVNDVALIKRDLYADGSGLVKRFDRFITQQETREIDRGMAEAKRDNDVKERHKENRYRLNVLLVLIPLLPLLSEIGKRLVVMLGQLFK